jgi:hypothetical protein
MSEEKSRAVRWCCVSGEGAEWARSAALSADGTTVFVPAVLCNGSETTGFLCASADGVDMLSDGDHIYLPATWVAKEFPKYADAVRLIERRTKEHFAK